jgi:hypothetical protein
MKPEDKNKLQDAWKKAVDNNPSADKPITGIFMNDGTPGTPRKLMEASLADEGFYEFIDKLLIENPSLTLDKWLKVAFSAPKNKGPKP